MTKPMNHSHEYMRLVAGQAHIERIAIPAGYEKQYAASLAYRALGKACRKGEPIIEQTTKGK